MPKLPIVTAKKLVKVLEKIGFRNSRSRGSHIIMVHLDGRRAVVPMHGKDIPNGTLLAILKDVGLSKEDLVGLI